MLNVPDKANAISFSRLNFALRDDNPDYAALLVAMRIFGDGTDSRLFNRLRQQDGLSYGAGGGTSVSSQDENASFRTYAIFNPNVTDKVAIAMQEELLRAMKDGFGAQEVEAKIKAVTPEMAKAALVKYVNPANLVVIRAGTFK